METAVNDRRGEVRRRFAVVAAGNGPADLLEACFLVAAEEYPDLDVAQEMRRVDTLGAEARARTSSVPNFFARVDILREYLFEGVGLRGNTEHFDDPRNSFLNEVLNRRLGIPITLSILYVEVARQAGFEAAGVGLPGHYVARVGDGTRSVLVDPFHGAPVITEEDCRELVARTTGKASLFRREVLQGSDGRATLVRLLLNLKRTYLAHEDYVRAHAVVERLLLVTPDDPKELRDRGFLLAHLGHPTAAAADLERYLSRVPEAPDAESVRGRLAWLLRRVSDPK